jgi:ribosomal protein L11 methyltransferase
MKYIEITVRTNTFGSELVSDIMWEYTDQGVAISDINDILELDRMKKGTWDYVDEELLSKKDTDVLVRGFVPADMPQTVQELEARIIALKDFIDEPLGSLETVKREIDGDEWLTKWKENFKPIRIGKIVVCPEWIKYDEKDGEYIVKLDSNMAFGTGEHETTSMCVEMLAEFVKPDDTVIDVGCGSGILGISASKLGAKKVIMTDIDECATSASEHNVKLNNVSNAEIFLKNLLDDDETVGDVVVANIMAEILVGFSKDIKKNVKNNGIIILSGILLSKEDLVLNAYVSAGFSHVKTVKKGEWCCMVFKN